MARYGFRNDKPGAMVRYSVTLWKAWDDFGIEDSEMIGYWDSGCPVSTDNGNVKEDCLYKR